MRWGGTGLILLGSGWLWVAIGDVESLASELPDTPKKPSVDTYWGLEIVDDYRYLEAFRDPEVVRWAEAQNAVTRAELDAYPYREALTRRVVALTHSDSPDYYDIRRRGGTTFAIKEEPPKEQPFLIVLDSLDDPNRQRVLVDPNVIDPAGGTTIDFYEPSLDGRTVAVSLSKDGTEDGTVWLYDVVAGRRLPDAIPRVNGGTAGGSVAWNASGDGFFYTRYPYPGERSADDLFFYQQIWFHRIGEPITEDHYVLGETFPQIAEIEMETRDDGATIIAEVSNGDGGEYEYWLRGPDEAWVKFAEFGDWIQKARFGPDGAIYLLSRKNAPLRRILRLPIDAPDLAAAEIVVDETDAVIEDFRATDSRLYVVAMWGGPSWLRVYDLGGRLLDSVTTDEVSTISSLVHLEGDVILMRRQSYTTPPAWFRYAPDLRLPEPTALAMTSPADFGDCEVRREFATADDGTKIPVDIILRHGTSVDGRAPLILEGYGSYGISRKPRFEAARRVWIEQGGVCAVACVRGGGEYGDEWHRAANLERKKVSMDDLAACARHLVERGYTSADRLAIEGGSAGGLLVYGTMAHYPDRMSAVVAHVGIGDALRTELSPNGEFNVTEFGTVKNESQFFGMLEASPYHQIRDGTVYPAVISLTGMNDPRVEPWQTFKMTARLQATGSPNPVLMRVSGDTGHGGGTALSDRDAELIDVYGFLFEQLGVTYRPVDDGERELSP